MLQGRVEQNEGPPDQPSEKDKTTPPQNPKTPGPPLKQRPTPPDRDPGPAVLVPLPTPLPSGSPNEKPPSESKSDQGPGRYQFGQPDPPFMFADGVSKRMGDCFAENLPMDLALLR